MLSTVKKIAIIASALLFVATTATPANNAEELVFSHTGGLMTLTGNANAKSTPFGFWIWCAFHGSPSSTPVTYQGADVCQGSMYFYFLGVPEHVVSAFLTKEPADGTYIITVFGFKSPQAAPDFMCKLENTPPITSGPSNTVNVNCTFFALGGGTGTATVTGAVVHDTGPSGP